MTDYEALRDSLICSKNNAIDNTAHDIICVMVNNRSEQEKKDAVVRLCEALSPDGTPFDKIESAIDVDVLLLKLEQCISTFYVPKSGDDVDWNMEYIAQVTGIVENMFGENNLCVCHPFFTNDEDLPFEDHYDQENGGVLCCYSCDRCPECRINTEKRKKRCPKCGCDRFIVSQHVVQSIMVDDEGNFISEVSNCDEVTHAADDDDIWECERCGYADAGSAFNVSE